MSWYSPIYTRVRLYRQKNPCRGWLLSKCLNLLLLLQFGGLFASIYVYVFHICGHLLTSCVQATIYVCIYATLTMLGFWSLVTTVVWPVRQVPANWKPKKERIEELKKVTPKDGDRYVVDKSTPEQTTQQKKILDALVKEMGCQQAECDQAGRQKFCYQCGHLKPDRTHHCSSCGHCVVHFDHHCPWINHCVSQSNYKFFLLYLIYSVSIIVWFLLGAIEALIRFFIRQRWAEDWLSIVLILALTIPFAIFGYLPLGEMLIYHWGLISINETTCEQAKPAVLKNDFQADYNMGRWNNIRQVFGPHVGLWFFPLPTTREDGMHFQIRYVECPKRKRLRRIEVKTSTDLETLESPAAVHSKASVVFEAPKDGRDSPDKKIEK